MDDQQTLDDIRRYRSGLGLPVTDHLLAYFLSEFKADRHPGGRWLTRAEDDEQFRIEGLIEVAREAAVPYIAEHRGDFAGEWLGYGVAKYHVGFARNVEAHREALLELMPVPEVLSVHDFDYPEAALQTIADRVLDEEDELARCGVRWVGSGIDVERNRVEVEVVAADRATAETVLADRYGPAVVVTWLGSEDTHPIEVPWDTWSIDDAGTSLTVHYYTVASFIFERADATEDEREVRVTVVEHVSVGGHVAMGQDRDATVTLARPLGDRPVIDGATGRERQPL